MRKLNPIFLTGLLAVTAFSGGLAYVVHGYQVVRNAEVLLDRARKAEQEGELPRAIEALKQYLNLRKDDAQAWASYARVLDESTKDRPGRARQQAFMVHEEALRHNPDDSKLERRCANLALELRPERTVEARQHLENLAARARQRMKEAPGDSGARLELAELEEMLGKCDVLESKFEDAAASFGSAIEHDPTRLSCYDQRARLLRGELRKKPEEADDEIERMVLNNPDSGLAYLYRFRYRREFPPAADPADLTKALQLAADSPDVLLTAAAVEEKSNPAAARTHLKEGLKLDPKNPEFAMMLARIELTERKPENAVEVLRHAFDLNPSADLALMLADTLILEGKIEGQAAEYIAYLREQGLGNTYVRYLEARAEVQKRNWGEAIPKIKAAQLALKQKVQASRELNLMLAECYSRLGYQENRLAALHQASAGPDAPDSARIELARLLIEARKFDDALAILIPLAQSRPELKVDIARLSIQKVLTQPAAMRNWAEAERRVDEAQAVLPGEAEAVYLLRGDLLTTQGRWDEAHDVLQKAASGDPRNLHYKLALARLAQRRGKHVLAIQILDQAEKDLGSNLEIMLARLGFLAQQGGDEAKAGVMKLSEARKQLSSGDLPRFLDQLATVELRLGERDLALQHWREVAAMEPINLQVLLSLFDLALEANDQNDIRELLVKIRKVDGADGTSWRFAEAAYLIDQARRGDTKKLDAARTLAAEIGERRPTWWGAPLLNAQISELLGQTSETIAALTRVVELENFPPQVIRRLVMLLNERNQFGEIERVTRLLNDRGVGLTDLTVFRALRAMRNRDFKQGLALARQVFNASSNSFSDHLSMGRLYLVAGQQTEAGAEFKRALELGPSVPETWLSYVSYLVQTGHIREAKEAVQAARKSLPSDQSSVALAQCFMMIGDTTEADHLLVSALKEKPADRAALRLAAVAALDQGRADQAEEFLNKLVGPSASPPAEDVIWANRVRARILLASRRPKDFPHALDLVNQNLKMNPESVEDLRLKGRVLSNLYEGRRGAITILEPLENARLLGRDDEFLLARLYLSEGREKEYQSTMLRILGHEPRPPLPLAHYIRFLIARSSLDQASHWMSELQRVDPKGLASLELEADLLKVSHREREILGLLENRGRQVPDQIGTVAVLLSHHGFAKEAEEAYRAFVAREPKDQSRVLSLASFLVTQPGRASEAIELLARAWKTCPAEDVALAAFPLCDVADLTDNQRKLVESWLGEASRKRPDLPALSNKLAETWIRQGRFDDVESLYRQILGSDPENTEVLNNLSMLLAMRDQAKAPEALELVDRAIRIQGTLPNLVDTRAVVLIRGGQADQAVKDLTEAQALDPKNYGLALHLAWAYQATGKPDDALKALKQAEGLGWTAEKSDPLERAFSENVRQKLER